MAREKMQQNTTFSTLFFVVTEKLPPKLAASPHQGMPIDNYYEQPPDDSSQFGFPFSNHQPAIRVNA